MNCSLCQKNIERHVRDRMMIDHQSSIIAEQATQIESLRTIITLLEAKLAGQIPTLDEEEWENHA